MWHLLAGPSYNRTLGEYAVTAITGECPEQKGKTVCPGAVGTIAPVAEPFSSGNNTTEIWNPGHIVQTRSVRCRRHHS
ncbi:hypothetical protein, partial [Nocardia thailandica]|uniref:hypothetical protein n=1 Tax=Nocardia thailandica TaxID=257275 RepID=UPI001C3F451B